MTTLPPTVTALLQALFHERDGQPDLRRSAAERAARIAGGSIEETSEPLPEVLAPWVDKVATRAYAITDDDMAALRNAGLDEDAIYEATVAAAVGASVVRMHAGLRALEESR
jgi:alkylhydroperoxidase family enzyme